MGAKERLLSQGNGNVRQDRRRGYSAKKTRTQLHLNLVL